MSDLPCLRENSFQTYNSFGLKSNSRSFFIKKGEFLMFLCEPLESPKKIGGDISDEPVTHCTEFL